MKINWGKRIAILASTIGLLMLAGFVLFTPQRTFATDAGCPAGHHPDPNGFEGCAPDTVSCDVGQHQEGSVCVDDAPWCPDGQHPNASGGCDENTVSCGAGQHPDESGVCTADEPGSGSPDAPTASAQASPPIPESISCGSWLNPNLQCFVGRLFYYAIYSTFGFLVWVSAAVLDLIIKLTILDFHNWAALPGIRIAWTVLRDTMNITFIFLLLYASISMILGLGKEKGIIKGVIMAGLLINFSFFFTSVIIDASNVLTVQMHDAVKRIGDSNEANPNNSVASQGGITGVFMQGAGIQVATIAGLDSASFVQALLQQMIFSSIMFLVLAFVFFAMGFLLLGRFVVLIILLITSPISVMGGLLPQVAGYSKKWWKALIDQAVFAPLMMLFLVVTAVIVSNEEFQRNFSPASTGMPESVPGLAGGVGGLVQYAIVIGLLIVGIVIAKSSAGAASNGAADWAIKKAQSIPSTAGRWAGAAAGGISGAAGRQFVAKPMQFLGNKYDVGMGNLAQSTNKWDQRVSKVARGLGIDEGIRDTFKGAASLKFGSQANLAEREKQVVQRTKELGQAVKEADDAQKIKDGLARTQQDLTAGTYDSTTDKIKDYLDTVAKMTDKQIEEMLATGQIDKLKKMAPDLTSKHMDKIMSSDLISDAVKGDINGARKVGLLDRVTAGKVKNVYQEAKKIASGKPHEVAQLPSDVLVDPAVSGHLSANVLAKIANDGKMGDKDKNTIRANITAAHAHLSRAATVRQLSADEQLQLNALKASTDWLKSDQGLVF